MIDCTHCKTPNPDFAVACSECSEPLPISDSATIQMVDPTALSAGSDFGPRYHIERMIGQGGMGRVYKARDKELDRIVAIKVVRQGAMGEGDALSRFKQELVLASKISHRNILRIHDLGDFQGMKFITMAFVDGQDLHQIIKDNQLPLERVLNFAMQLADALAAAHEQDVVHRDFKPQNILVDKNDQIYVSDFGLAKSFAEGAIGMTQTGAFLGTPRYMSPEQVEGKPTDGRSDLYAFGLILYEMVTGDVPFTGESTLGVMYQRIKENPKSPKTVNPSLPNWLVKIIMRCLERDPAARYQSAHEILADLEAGQLAGGASGSFSRRMSRSIARPATSRIIIPQDALPRFRWMRPWMPVAAGIVLLVALVFAIPQSRHLIFRGRQSAATPSTPSLVPGVPSISSGRYVAVLPLQVIGDASKLGYVAKGINEAVSAKLSQLKGVNVTPNDAADQADQKLPLPKLAHALGANLIVQGEMQASGDKIRLIVNLEDVADAKRIWSREFDGVLGDLFTLEDQVYDQIVWGINVNPTDQERATAQARPTDNAAAYDLYLRGRNALRGHDAKSIQSALDFFDQALKSDPRFPLAYTGVADASLRMNTIKNDSLWTQKALAAAQQAEQLNDKLPEVHALLGSVYSAMGRYPEAVAELKTSLSQAPNSDEFYRRLGDVYLNSGNVAQAVDAYQKAVTLNPYYWVNYNKLGKGYAHRGDFPKALQAYQQVAIFNPDIAAGYENVGNMYLQQGKYKESVPYYQKALHVEPYFSTYSNLGTSYFFLKQYSSAVEMFEKAVELNPNNTFMRVNLADAYRGAGEQDKARAAYQQAVAVGFKELQTNPKNAEVMTQMALSYAKIGNSAEAENFIRQARAIDNNNVSYIYDDAQIEALLGHSPQALALLREAFEKHYPAEYAAGDEDLRNLAGNPEFVALVKQYSKNPK